MKDAYSASSFENGGNLLYIPLIILYAYKLTKGFFLSKAEYTTQLHHSHYDFHKLRKYIKSKASERIWT